MINIVEILKKHVHRAIESGRVASVNSEILQVLKIITLDVYQRETGKRDIEFSEILNDYNFKAKCGRLDKYKFNSFTFDYFLNQALKEISNENYFPYEINSRSIKNKDYALDILYEVVDWYMSNYVDSNNSKAPKEEPKVKSQEFHADMSSNIKTSPRKEASPVKEMHPKREVAPKREVPPKMEAAPKRETPIKKEAPSSSVNRVNRGNLPMVDMRIRSNPFTKKNLFYVNEVPFFNKNVSGKYRNRLISTLSVNFIKDIAAEFKNSDINIVFEGSTYDFEDMEVLVNEYNKISQNTIYIKPGKLIYDLNRNQELKQLKHMMLTSKIDDFENQDMHKYFNMYMEEKNEVVVVATMSSGKSTLLNSILGRKLMPSKNDACTAKIFHIANNNSSVDFKDKKGNIITNDYLKKLNDNADTDVNVEISGPIKQFNDIDNFKLIDTPGPNNSLDSTHQTITYNFIKSDRKPVIIVMLDGTKLMTTDESDFIDVIARETKNDGKIDEDRFIFVINKADNFKSDDNANEMKEKTVKALKAKGINNPKIHFISSMNALLARLELNNCEITDDDEDDIYTMKRKVKREAYKFHTLSDISPSIRKKVDDAYNAAFQRGDYINAGFVASGVYGLELTIKEYMNKYKSIRKVNNIVTVCQDTIKKNNSLNDIQNKINFNKRERDKLEDTIKQFNSKINNDKKIHFLKEEINNIKFADTLKPIEISITREFNDFTKIINSMDFEVVNGKRLIATSKAMIYIEALQKKYEHLKADLLSEFERSITNDIQGVINNTISKYKNYISDICDDMSVDTDIDFSSYVESSAPDFVELSKNSVISETVTSVEFIKNPDRKGLKSIFIWRPKKIAVYEEEHKEGMEYKTIVKYLNDAKQDLYQLYSEIKAKRDEAKEKCIREVNSKIYEFNTRIQRDLSAITRMEDNLERYKNAVERNEKLSEAKGKTIKAIKQKLEEVISI